MALILGIREGRSFYLGDLKVSLERIQTPTRVKVKVHGAIDQIMTLGPNNRTELIPGVYASIGTDSTIEMAKIVIEAPRSIKILRDNLYDAAN